MKDFLELKIMVAFGLVVTALDSTWPIAFCTVSLVSLWGYNTYLKDKKGKNEKAYEKELKALADRVDALQVGIGMTQR